MCRLLTQQYIRQESNNFPTLIQEEIKKQFEIRVFYLRSRCYSIAMFTQTNETTKTDYRNYNFTAPVRSVPFNLPRSLDIKVKQLMKEINLNSGSIDFIYSSNNEFIFLEVNPLGQFGNVSAAGNYFIEKKIANLLYDKQNSNRKKH